MMDHKVAQQLDVLAQTRLWELVAAAKAICEKDSAAAWAELYRAVAAVPDRDTIPRRHEWGKSRVGHGEAQCRFCLITNREAMAIAPIYCNTFSYEGLT